MDAPNPAGIYQFGEYRLDRRGGGLFRCVDGNRLVPVVIGSRALGVLDVLVERHGELVAKDTIMAAVWPDTVVEEANLSVQISALRRVLDYERSGASRIQTVPGRGYRFVAPVARLPEGAGAPEAPLPPVATSVSPDASLAHQGPAGTGLVADPYSRLRVGREVPLERLDNLLPQVRSGNRQVVFITGEAGIGKTTFVEMAMERMSQARVGVLWGRCTEMFGTDEAFLPLIEALQERCRGADGVLLLKSLRDLAPTWLAQMPEFLDAKDRALFQAEVFGATRERMLREFCDLAEALSLNRPLVIVLEDLHWSDFATLDVLTRLARADRRASILILATYRPADVMIEGHPVRTVHRDLQIHGRCEELVLDRLSLADIARYLRLRFGERAMVQTLAERIFDRTGGQPLFVVSLVDDLVARRAIFEVDGQWDLAADGAASEWGVPSNLREMLGSQIDRLSADEQLLLEVASAAGAEFSVAIVAEAADHDAIAVERIFESLARKGHVLVTTGVTEWPDQTFSGCYAFLHALYQEVLYQRLAAGRRVQIHRRLGARLEAGYKSQTAEIAPVLALHFEQGRDFAKAMRYLGQAAENSAKRLGNREAVSYLTRALGLVDRLPADHRATAQMALLRQRSWARRSAGDLKGSLEDLNAMISCAAESGQPRMEVSGLLAVSRVCLHADRRQCLRAAELALEKSHALDDEVFKALVQGTSASTNLYLKGWRNEDAELCRHCLRLTADAHDHGTLIRRYGIEGIVKCSTAEYLDCRVAATKGKNMARDIGDVFIFVLFNVLESTALLHLGEWRELRRGTIAALAMAERNANVPASVLCRLTLAWLHVEALDFEGAKQRCEEIEDSVFDANPFAFYFQRAVLAKALVGSRDLAGAATRFDDITRRLEAEGGDLDFTIYTQFHHSLCEYYLDLGELSQARTHAEKLYRYAAPAPDRNHLALAHRLLARTAQAEDDLAEAGIQIERAVATLGDADLPLAAWRVYSTAAAFYESIGDVGRAADYHRRYEAVIHALAANFDEGDPLRTSLLAGLAANPGH